MREDINRAETRIALNILREINENSKEIRKDVVMDYVLNALGLGMVVEEKDLREFPEVNIYKSETKKAIKAFNENDNSEEQKMTTKEARMQARDLLNNFENHKVTEIDKNDIRALRKLTEEKTIIKPNRIIKLNLTPIGLENTLNTLIKYGIVEEDNFSNLDITITK